MCNKLSQYGGCITGYRTENPEFGSWQGLFSNASTDSPIWFLSNNVPGCAWSLTSLWCRRHNYMKLFNIHMSVHRYYILRVQPTRCNVSQFIYFCKTLYTFQTGFPSIIRSSKLHIQRQAFVRPAASRPATTICQFICHFFGIIL